MEKKYIKGDSLMQRRTINNIQKSFKEPNLIKSGKAFVGEIREWKGQKMKKQADGSWMPVKEKVSKKTKEVTGKVHLYHSPYQITENQVNSILEDLKVEVTNFKQTSNGTSIGVKAHKGNEHDLNVVKIRMSTPEASIHHKKGFKFKEEFDSYLDKEGNFPEE